MKYSSEHISDAVLARFLTGESPVRERGYVEDWAERSPDGAAELFALEKAGTFVYASRPTPNLEAALVTHRRRRTSAAPLGPIAVSIPARITSRSWTRWAGATLLAIVVCLGVQRSVTLDGRASRVVSARTMSSTFITRPGQSIAARLPDGSFVVLAPMTVLRYTSGEGGRRDIQLDGEALFTVVNENSLPFIVRSGRSTVRVLGTTFAVRQYPTDTATQVVVAQGKVAVNAQVLSSGETAAVGTTGIVSIERGANISSALAWTTGTLTFRRTPLREVVRELERWYGVTFSIRDDALLNRPITAVFLLDSPHEAVDILASLLGTPISIRATSILVGSRNL